MDAANPWVGQSSTAPTPAATQPPRTLVRRRSEDEDDDSHVVKRIPVSNATRQEVEEARAKAIALESRLEYTENLVESMQVAWQQRDVEMEELRAAAQSHFREQVREVEEARAAAEARAMQQEQLRLEQEARLLAQYQEALQKDRAEYETRMAVMRARTTNFGPPLPDAPGFPHGPAVLNPQFVSRETLQARQIAVAMRAGVDNNTPLISLAPATSGTSSTPAASGSAMPPFDMNEPADVQRLAQVVAGVLASNGTTITNVKKRKKASAVSSLTTKKKQQQGTMTKTQDEGWKKFCREVWRASTGLDRARDFAEYTPTSEEEAKLVSLGQATATPGVTKLFFGKSYRTHFLNAVLLKEMVKEAALKRVTDPNKFNLPDTTGEYVHGLFHNFLKQAGQTWRMYQPRPGETPAQARARADAADAKTRSNSVARSRKVAKFNRRVETVNKTIKMELAKNSTERANLWRFLLALVQKLDVAGMSSEESEVDDGPDAWARPVIKTVHNILVCEWREPKVTQYMKWVDQANPSAKNSNARRRIRIDKVSTADAPKGLPRSLYDENWLSHGMEYDDTFEEELEISREVFEFLQLVEGNLRNETAMEE